MVRVSWSPCLPAHFVTLHMISAGACIIMNKASRMAALLQQSHTPISKLKPVTLLEAT